MNEELMGKPLRYLIGSDADVINGSMNTITEVPWGAPMAKRGISIGYCNLFDEKKSGRYGPYLHDSDTAEKYGEGQIDSSGAGWAHNLDDQFRLRKQQGFRYIELDNPDAYPLLAVMKAIERARAAGFEVIAKNPGLGCNGEHADSILRLPHVAGMIVESGAGTPASLDTMRRMAGRPFLPIWFVFWGERQRARAITIALQASYFYAMGVTHSPDGEYTQFIDLHQPEMPK